MRSLSIIAFSCTVSCSLRFISLYVDICLCFIFPFYLFALINISISFMPWIQAIIKQDFSFVLACIFFLMLTLFLCFGSQSLFVHLQTVFRFVFFFLSLYLFHILFLKFISIKQLFKLRALFFLTIFTFSLNLRIWEEALISDEVWHAYH